MDSDIARGLFEAGAMLILLDVPHGTEIGIDMHSWRTAENFKGIKMIPPGIHMIYFSAANQLGQLSPRSSFLQHFSEGDILVRKWDAALECFTPPLENTEQLQRFRDNKKELDRYCGPYPYESYKKWLSLSDHISDSVVKRVQPSGGVIYSATSLISEASDTASRAAHAKEEQIPLNKTTADNLLSDMKESPDAVMNYTKIQRFLKESSAASITQCAVDSSPVLEEVLHSAGTWQSLLGEIQLAFLCFLIGQQFESFDQWKKSVALLCGCQDAVSRYEDLYTQLISLLHFQLKEMPSDFFVDIVSRENFLVETLHSLLVNIGESTANQSLKGRAVRFGDHLSSKFGWDFQSEPDDCAPVIVDEMGNY